MSRTEEYNASTGPTRTAVCTLGFAPPRARPLASVVSRRASRSACRFASTSRSTLAWHERRGRPSGDENAAMSFFEMDAAGAITCMVEEDRKLRAQRGRGAVDPYSQETVDLLVNTWMTCRALKVPRTWKTSR